MTLENHHFNRKYIFKWWIFQPVMLVFGGVRTRIFLKHQANFPTRVLPGVVVISLVTLRQQISPFGCWGRGLTSHKSLAAGEMVGSTGYIYIIGYVLPLKNDAWKRIRLPFGMVTFQGLLLFKL